MWWLILENALSGMTQAMKDARVTAADIQAYESRSGDNRALSIAGDKAEIAVTGVLTPRPNFMAAFFGGGNTTYPDIVDAIARAEQDDKVNEIAMYFDTPGGSTAGMFEAMSAIANAKKPVKAYVVNAYSAGFGLASQADERIATSRASGVGSVGIVTSRYVEDNLVEITSTNAPDKRPDASTEEGVATIRAQLDETEALFIEQIAAGVGVSEDDVKKDFGRGGTMLADSALKRGMIDAIEPDGLARSGGANPTTAQQGGETNEAKPMNLAELKAQHPELYAEAVADGTNAERDRVSAHLTLGKQSGAMDIATKAIEDGDGLTMALQAKYMSAGMDKRDTENRAEDEADTSEAANGADDQSVEEASEEDKAEAGKAILNEALAIAGVEVEA